MFTASNMVSHCTNCVLTCLTSAAAFVCACHNRHSNSDTSDSIYRLMLRDHQMKCLPRSARWWRPSDEDNLLITSVSLRKPWPPDQTHPNKLHRPFSHSVSPTSIFFLVNWLHNVYAASRCMYWEVSCSYCDWEHSFQINVKSAISIPDKIWDGIPVLRFQCAPFMLSCTAPHLRHIISSMQELQLSLRFVHTTKITK